MRTLVLVVPKDSKESALPRTPMGERMYERLDELGLTQADVMMQIGASQHNFHRWAIGRTKINGANLVELARALHCTVEWLWGGETSSDRDVRLRAISDFLSSEDATKPPIETMDRRTLQNVVFYGRVPSPDLYKQWYFALKQAPKL